MICILTDYLNELQHIYIVVEESTNMAEYTASWQSAVWEQPQNVIFETIIRGLKNDVFIRTKYKIRIIDIQFNSKRKRIW